VVAVAAAGGGRRTVQLSGEADGAAAVAAYLRQHGVDPDRLAGEQPEAWAHLTLPLAEVLIEFLRGRNGLRLIATSPTDAAYLARLDFLHCQVGPGCFLTHLSSNRDTVSFSPNTKRARVIFYRHSFPL